MLRLLLGTAAWVALAGTALATDPLEKPSAREALRPFNDLIGSWRATGAPQGTRQQKQTGFWTEGISWEWQFKGADAWLKVVFDKGKYFTRGELRPLPGKGRYRLTLRTIEEEDQTFEGELEDNRLTLQRTDVRRKETQRLVLSLLHSNRFLYRYEVKPDGKPLFHCFYQVGATKEGVPFASGDGKPECIVSGGLGTIRVTHKGQTYYVCCGGCRDAFNEDPDKFIREYQARKK